MSSWTLPAVRGVRSSVSVLGVSTCLQGLDATTPSFTACANMTDTALWVQFTVVPESFLPDLLLPLRRSM